MSILTDRQGLEKLARFGLGSRGVVYLVVGGLALLAAMGSGGQTTGTKGALQTLMEQPFGRVIVGIVALGLAAFALWRFVEAIADPDGRGSDWKGLALRTGRGLSGVIYVGLAIFALSLAFGWGSGSSDDNRAARDWTAWLLDKPFGQWLVALVGLAIVAAGIAFAVKGWKAEFRHRLVFDADVRRWAVPLGRIGHIARGFVFLLIGAFLILAAWHSNAGEAIGLGGALRELQRWPYGWIVLGATALGLVAFGVFGIIEALYRRIDAPSLQGLADGAAEGARRVGLHPHLPGS